MNVSERRLGVDVPEGLQCLPSIPQSAHSRGVLRMYFQHIIQANAPALLDFVVDCYDTKRRATVAAQHSKVKDKPFIGDMLAGYNDSVVTMIGWEHLDEVLQVAPTKVNREYAIKNRIISGESTSTTSESAGII